MSGFLPDLASWALGSQGNNNSNDDNDKSKDDAETSSDKSSENQALTKDEIRARRLGRLMNNVQIENNAVDKSDSNAMDNRKPAARTNMTTKNSSEENISEEIKPKAPPSASASSTLEFGAITSGVAAKPAPDAFKLSSPTAGPPLKRHKEEPTAQSNSNKAKPTSTVSKLNKKKENLLKKCLLVSIVRPNNNDNNNKNVSTENKALVPIEVEFDELDHENASRHISEILAARLSMEPGTDSLLNTTPSQKPGIIAYLGHCHRLTSEQIKLMQQDRKSASSDDTHQILQLLLEIQKQVVNYAASSLMEPDLFVLGNNSTKQLAKCLISSGSDISSSIVFGTSGTKSSFYCSLCEELISQDLSSFQSIIQETASHITKNLEKGECILDSGDGRIFSITALKLLCSHKKAAQALTMHKDFLLPASDSAEAKTRISNIPPGATPSQQQIFQMMQALNRGITGYLKRSGPGLEKQTILGRVFKFGLPMDNQNVLSPFQNAASQTLKQINLSTSSMRRQLKLYHDESFNLIKVLVNAGPQAKDRVMTWISDALLVNTGATAMRPDRTKVSNSQTLLNIGVTLLKLCEPFVSDPKKYKLIDSGFVLSPEHHKNVFAMTGDDAIPRLSQNPSTASQNCTYNPKNTFIPQLFFFTARMLHLGLIPSSGYHTSLMRRVNHTAYSLRQRNADVMSDPDFNQILAMQYASETSVLNPDMLSDALRFFNVCASFLNDIDDDRLPLMPEHLVDDMCDLITFETRMATKAMQGIDLGNVFKLTVKLLSPRFAHTIRNYNLRAKLGDVLYDVFLPSKSGDDRDVPSSIFSDPLAGGQPYLLSDKSAQETLAPSLLLLYGEVEHTGHYEQMSHRSHIASLLQYLWENKEHRPAFRRITQNKESFIKFANGIVNETNGLIANVMEKLPEIKRTQDQMQNPQQWGALTDEQKETIRSRHEENEQDVKRALPLCNKTLQMLGFLNTDREIRNLFLLEEMCGRLVNLLMNVLTKLVGSRGLELKVNNPESYNFRPKEMLRDICSIFSTFYASSEFQVACAKSAFYKTDLLSKSVQTCRKFNLLGGNSMENFESLAKKVETAARSVEDDEALTADAPEEYLDPLTYTFMTDPVILPTSNTVIDRSTIAQHLLNDPHDPFNRKELTMEMVVPATELKDKMTEWLNEKKKAHSTIN